MMVSIWPALSADSHPLGATDDEPQLSPEGHCLGCCYHSLFLWADRLRSWLTDLAVGWTHVSGTLVLLPTFLPSSAGPIPATLPSASGCSCLQ